MCLLEGVAIKERMFFNLLIMARLGKKSSNSFIMKNEIDGLYCKSWLLVYIKMCSDMWRTLLCLQSLCTSEKQNIDYYDCKENRVVYVTRKKLTMDHESKRSS